MNTGFSSYVRMMSGPRHVQTRYLHFTIACNRRMQCLARLMALKCRFGLRHSVVSQWRLPAFDDRMRMNLWARNVTQ